MPRDSQFKWGLICATAAIAAVLIALRGLSFPIADLVEPVGLAALLGLALWYYHRRGETRFVACLGALLHVTLFTACYSVAMYAAAASEQPLVDAALMRADAACGVHVPSIVNAVRAVPPAERAFQWAYNSLLWQTPLVIIVLGFSGDLTRLNRFVLQFMLATLACLAVFAFFPAAGPFAAYGYEPNATQFRYLQHLHELRGGMRTVVTWRHAEGLITFPSFHTTWAILLAWAFARRRGLRWLAWGLNAAVIAATLTTGWHYFADVAGGVVVAGVVIAATTPRRRKAIAPTADLVADETTRCGAADDAAVVRNAPQPVTAR